MSDVIVFARAGADSRTRTPGRSTPTIACASAAGWFAPQAQKGEVSVRFANGEVRTRSHWLLVRSDPNPGPGSEVLVPVRDTTEHENYASLFTSIVQIIASTVTAIYVIKHL